jgi:MFS family permease
VTGTTEAQQSPSAEPAPRRRFHRAWLVAAVTMAALVAAAAFRSTTGALFEPLESEFGWTRSETSGAVTANLIIYGLVAPFAAVLMERFSVRAVIATALGLVALGSGLTVVMTDSWQLWVLWGGFVGVGTGAMALVFGAMVANRWFHRHRGLVMGVFSAANACGQLAFLPTVVHVAAHEGWRAAALGVAALAITIIPLLFWPFADSPQRVGVQPYGADETTDAETAAVPRRNIAAETIHVLREATHSRAFWISAAMLCFVAAASFVLLPKQSLITADAD